MLGSEIKMNYLITARVTDIVLVNQKSRTCKVTNFTAAEDQKLN